MFSETVILVVSSGSEEPDSAAHLLGERHRVISVDSSQDALSYLSDGVDLVVIDLDSSHFSALPLLRTWRSRSPATPAIVFGYGKDIKIVIEAMKLGAADCLIRPFNSSELQASVDQSLESGSPVSATAAADEPEDEGNSRNIDIPPGTSLEDLERAAVEQALAQHHGNRTHAARTLGISVRTLQRKLKAWGLPILSMQANVARSSFVYLEQQPTPITPHVYTAH